MRRYSLLVLSLCLFFLAGFLVGGALGVPYLSGTEWVDAHALPSAVIIVNALLVADVLLPIPSSLLMVANGALLGLLWGAAASLVSATLSALLAFWLGRRGAPWLMRRISPQERARAEHFFDRWGAMAVMVTRPVPILAEATGVLAGTTGLGWARFGAAAAAGNLPPALLYAFAGAMARRATYGLLVFAILLAIAALWWFVGRGAERAPS
jgi:uncharacterized membrane protein YdjX (TVP38/TMEM64 family)